jgi:hypothetical protein
MIALATRRRATTVAPVNRVWLPSVAVLACALVGLELDHDVKRGMREVRDGSSGAVCTWSAAGDDDQPATALLSAVRIADGATLHRVICSDGWNGWQWLRDPRSPDDPGADAGIGGGRNRR